MIRVSTITRVGNHEVVRVRPFVRVAGNLSLTVSDLSANIPPFNPQRLLAESATRRRPRPADDAPAAEPDAEVAFVHARPGADLAEAQDRACSRRTTK